MGDMEIDAEFAEMCELALADCSAGHPVAGDGPRDLDQAVVAAPGLDGVDLDMDAVQLALQPAHHERHRHPRRSWQLMEKHEQRKT